MAANSIPPTSTTTTTADATTTTTKKKKKSKIPPIQPESTQTHPQTPPHTNQQVPPSSSESSGPSPNRTKSPGVRVVGNRIYDSLNGKTCHQCRQKTMDFVVTCTNQSENKKQCPLHVCQKCLLNRYGENAEEAVASGDWKCPRCRGICNCSFCMKKRGCGPTGILIHTAKKAGFDSVSNLLKLDGSTVDKVVKCGARKKRNASDKETGDEPETKMMKEDGERVEKENVTDENTIEDTTEDRKAELQLPLGTELTNLSGVDLPLGDIGHALQLLEFCETFGEVLQLKNGEAEILLRELACTNEHKTDESLTVRFHTRLLALIQDDLGKLDSGKSWVEAFKECISESQYPSKDSLLDFFNLQPSGYDDLNFSKKLRLLNFLCDEALGTVKLRSWIDERNVEEKKKAKETLIANREKEKNMKKKVQDEVAKAILSQNGIPLSTSEQKDLITRIKAETAQTLANSREMRDIPRESYVIRSEPILLDINGCKLWKLRSLSDEIGILLQDCCYGEVITSDEKWFVYNDQEKTLVDEYISNSRNL